MQHANDAIDEVRRAEFFRQGPKKRGLIKGKKWLLLSRWKNLTETHRGDLNRLFQLNRRVFKAYLLKESLRAPVELPLCAKISETPFRPTFSVGGGEGNAHEDEGKRCCI